MILSNVSFQTAASILADGKAEKLSELVRRNLIREDVHAMPQGSKIGNDTSLKISAVKSGWHFDVHEKLIFPP